MLLPPDISELIPANSMARLVDAIVGRMDRRLLESLYPGGGAPAHDPSMMLKVETWARSIPSLVASERLACSSQQNHHR